MLEKYCIYLLSRSGTERRFCPYLCTCTYLYMPWSICGALQMESKSRNHEIVSMSTSLDTTAARPVERFCPYFLINAISTQKFHTFMRSKPEKRRRWNSLVIITKVCVPRIAFVEQVLDCLQAILLAITFYVWSPVCPINGLHRRHALFALRRRHLLNAVGISHFTWANGNIIQLPELVFENLEEIEDSPGN